MFEAPRVVYVLFNRHGTGRVEGTTTSPVAADAWRQADPNYNHVVESLLPAAGKGPSRSTPGGFLGGAPLYVLHDQHGDGSVQGVTISLEVAHAWHTLDAGYRCIIPTLLNHLDFHRVHVV